MPGPGRPVRRRAGGRGARGRVSEAAVDDKVAAARCGSARAASARSTARRATRRATRPGPTTRSRPSCARTAAASFVLARNHGTLLPLERALAAQGRRARPERGRRAHARRRQRDRLPALHGLAARRPARRARDAEVTHAPGVRTHTRLPVAHVSARRRALLRRRRDRARRRAPRDRRVHLARDARPGGWRRSRSTRPCAPSARASTSSAARAPGRYRLTLRRRAGASTSELGAARGRRHRRGAVRPAAARRAGHAGRGRDARRRPAPRGRGRRLVTLRAQLRAAVRRRGAELERAVALAREADVAIVVVGTTAEVESEGFDRTTLALPGRQDELVAARQRGAAAHGRRRQRRRAGAAAVAGRGAGRAAVLVPGPGGGQRARRRALRRRRARRAAADDLAGVRGRPAVGDAGRRRPAPTTRGWRSATAGRRRAAAAVRPRPRLHDAGSTWRWTARPCG